MKLKSVHLEKFKRFTDLTIDNIPETIKLVVLVGPNGCGKSSLFDAFKAWHTYKGFGFANDKDYYRKDAFDDRNGFELVNIEFHGNLEEFKQPEYRNLFYFRTAYRNTPMIQIGSLQKLESPLDSFDRRLMIQNDSTVDDNYQRLMSATINELYDTRNDEKTVGVLRDELINKIRLPMSRLFPDLSFSKLGVVTDKAEFYFDKGTTKDFGYEKLSGGEKAAFDLILDFIVKNEYYKDTVFCIDEPETHIHTHLQAKLLSELFNLINENSQLWVATHSFGMLKEAKRLSEIHPGEIAFIDFEGFDFDESVTITPSKCNSILWKKILEITLDDYSSFLVPDTIVFCEGTSKGRKRKDFDARCYSNIFGEHFPNVVFLSAGNCELVAKEEQMKALIKSLSPESRVIKLVDKDDRSPEEIADLKDEGVTVLSRRTIESYLLDDEVLEKWCNLVGQSSKSKELIDIKRQSVQDSINRGNQPDDLKSAANEIVTKGKKLLGETGIGNNGETIMRDTISKLITPEMSVYKQLEKDIFLKIRQNEMI